MNSQKEYSKIDVKLNRLLSQKAALQYRMKRKETSDRKARTRTLIQIGGLVELTPLPSLCGIVSGDDLQLDYPDKAAVLLGILSELIYMTPGDISENDLARFREIGKNLLKQRIR